MTDRSRELSGLAAVLVLAAATPALAGGQFLPVRGTRPTARGGAFVAGADDLQSLWFNPAGLAALAGGRKVDTLVDLMYVGHAVSYTRVDSGGNPQPTVESDPQLLPAMTFAGAVDLSPRAVLGVGFLTPAGALDAYPEDGPQRYSLVTLHQSAIGMLEGAIGYRALPWLTVGGGVQNLIFRFRSRVVFSACPEEIACAPEDPEFDTLGEVDAWDVFSPSAVLGAQADVGRKARFGMALQLPFLISAGGKVRVRLPASGFYNGAHVEGDRADVDATLPAMLRGGVQLSPLPSLRVEAAFDWEMWSQQDEIAIEPKGVRLEDGAGVGMYELGPLRVPRGFRDTLALRLGLEAVLPRLPVTLRGGYVYETGAPRREYLSVMAVDTNKHVATVGLGVRAGSFRVDAAYGHVFMQDADVGFQESCVPLMNPIRSGTEGEACVHDDDPDHVYVGGGSYQSAWDVVGIGVALEL